MTRARGSLGVSMGPTNSHHSLQGDVLILCPPFSRGGRGGGGARGRGQIITFPLPPSDYPHLLVTPFRKRAQTLMLRHQLASRILSLRLAPASPALEGGKTP